VLLVPRTTEIQTRRNSQHNSNANAGMQNMAGIQAQQEYKRGRNERRIGKKTQKHGSNARTRQDSAPRVTIATDLESSNK
jgi:hypothetical protein